MSLADWAQRLWGTYHVHLGLVGLGALLGMLLYARITKGRRPVKPALIWLGSNLALVFNAEGMWHVATATMHLPPGFVVLIFAVFEIALMMAQMVASDRYKATTVRHPEDHDKAGQVSKPGHPGKMLYVAWTIALLSGVIVATAASTTTEKILRLGLPIIVILMWWGTLTAEGQEARRSKFAHSPRRLMERWGWLVPDEDPDYRRMAQERRLRALVAHGYRLRAGTVGAWLWEWRLIRIARVADEDTLCAAEDRVTRLTGIKTRFRDGAPRPPYEAEVPGQGSAPDAIEVPPGSSGSSTPAGSAGTSTRKRTGTSTRNNRRKVPARRTAEHTRKLAAELAAQQPGLTQAALATRLGITDRRLREVLKGSAVAVDVTAAASNGHEVPESTAREDAS